MTLCLFVYLSPGLRIPLPMIKWSFSRLDVGRSSSMLLPWRPYSPSLRRLVTWKASDYMIILICLSVSRIIHKYMDLTQNGLEIDKISSSALEIKSDFMFLTWSSNPDFLLHQKHNFQSQTAHVSLTETRPASYHPPSLLPPRWSWISSSGWGTQVCVGRCSSCGCQSEASGGERRKSAHRDPLHSHCDLQPVIPDLWKLYEVTNVKNR